MKPDPYATGVLVEEHHHRLVANLEGFAKDAGIKPHWIWTRLSKEITGAEREYLLRFKHHETEGKIAGMCYVGKALGVDMRMQGIAGLMVRNFVRARVMTLGGVVDASAGRTLPDLTCLLIPNFYLLGSHASTIAKWQLGQLYDTLVDRSIRGRQTILYVEDMEGLAVDFGLSFKELIDQHYLKVSV